MCRAPVGLDDATLGAVAKHDPITDLVWSAEVERYAREHVGERALQGKAKDDSEDARRGDQRPDRRVEDVGNDRERGAEVDDADHELLKQAAFLRPAFENQEDMGGAGQQPRGVDPPDDLGRCNEDPLIDRRLLAATSYGTMP